VEGEARSPPRGRRKQEVWPCQTNALTPVLLGALNHEIWLVRGNGRQIVYKPAIRDIHPAEPVQLMDPASFR
jgi:hypothetical protein